MVDEVTKRIIARSKERSKSFSSGTIDFKPTKGLLGKTLVVLGGLAILKGLLD